MTTTTADTWHGDSQQAMAGREHVRNVWPELGAALDGEVPSFVLPERHEMFITFGQVYAREPHPTFPAAHPSGYFVVEYGDDTGYGRARHMAYSYLEGAYAFDYTSRDELDPDGHGWYPRGELGRIVLP
jgi:hypothetical protein